MANKENESETNHKVSRMGKYDALGNMFMQMREARGLTQAAVAENLMSQRALSNFETQGELPNRLVFNAIVQRIGNHPDCFVTMLSRQEYEYLLWRRDMVKAIWENTLNEQDWECEMARDRSIHGVLQEQFVSFWKGYIVGNVEQMKYAIALTVTDFPRELSLDTCVSTEEISYMLLYLEKKHELATIGHAEQVLLISILSYIEEKLEPEEQIKVYGRAVCVLGEYMDMVNANSKVLYYKKALRLQRRMGSLTEIDRILQGVIDQSEVLGQPVDQEYRDELWAIRTVKEDFHISKSWVMSLCMHQEYYLLNEVLKNYRMERKIPVREIGEQACSEKTYRALENGKRSANKGTYELLADMMEIPFNIYSADIVTDRYEDLLLVERIKRRLRQQKYEEGHRIRKELEESFGEKVAIKQNLQFIKSMADAELYDTKQITAREYQKRVEDTIRITIPQWSIDYETHFYTRREMILVYYEIRAFRGMGDTQTALKLVRKLWKQLMDSEVDIAYRREEAVLILAIWKNLLTDEGRYEEALEIAKEGILFCFQSDRGDKLGDFVFELGWILNQPNYHTEIEYRKEIRMKYLRCSLYISRLFFRMSNVKIIEDYIDEDVNG